MPLVICQSRDSTNPVGIKPKVVAIGNSHLMAMSMALGSIEADTHPFEAVCLPLNIAKYRPFLRNDPQTKTTMLNEAFTADAAALIVKERPVAVFCFASGLFAFANGSWNLPRPFDFVLPTREDLDLVSGVDIIPYDLIMDAALAGNRWWLQIIDLARKATDAPVYSVCLPPPVASLAPFRAKLRAKLNDDKWSKLDAFGEAPKALRYKTWSVQTEADRVKAHNAGAKFLWPPRAALDNDGFLRDEYSSGDILHANQQYGDLMLCQVAEIVRDIKNREP